MKRLKQYFTGSAYLLVMILLSLFLVVDAFTPIQQMARSAVRTTKRSEWLHPFPLIERLAHLFGQGGGQVFFESFFLVC